MNEEYLREVSVHGSHWDKIHGHYFSDPSIAHCLVNKTVEVVRASKPHVIADLGGGTGFFLSELAKEPSCDGIRMVDIDLSDAQLSCVHNFRLSSVGCSIECVSRGDICGPSERALFVSRSTFHYFGKAGIAPLLSHLRSEMEEGEFLIHQSACFESQVHADCLNLLYGSMRTHKWYPSVNGLSTLLNDAGFTIGSVLPAPPLALTSEDLSFRYGLSKTDSLRIGKEMMDEFGEIEDVFHKRDDGFTAFLHYKIFACTAV